MVRSLYKSADMEDDLSITLQPMGGLRHMRGHFGVVFRSEGSPQLALSGRKEGRKSIVQMSFL